MAPLLARPPALAASPLVRQLQALGLAESGASAGATSLAEQVAPWLAWTDAIALAGALDAAPPPKASPARAEAARRDALARLDTVRRALALAIAQDAPAGFDADEAGPEATPGRRYRAHQQAMDRQLTPLRQRLRAALAARSPRLGRIALLDQALEQALAARERELLAAIPAWLDRRLQRAPADPATLTRPLLQAELAHRLAPVEGLAAALCGPEGTA